MITIPDIPDEDTELIRLAESTATDGTTIHTVVTEVGIYRNALAGAERLAGMIRDSGEREGDEAELQKRLCAAEEYRAKLQARVAKARLARGASS